MSTMLDPGDTDPSQAESDARFRARVGAALFGIAGALGVVGAIANGAGPAAVPASWGTMVISLAGCVLLLTVGPRLPPVWPQVAAGVATFGVGVNVWFDSLAASAPEAGAITFYLLIGLFVGYFCGPRAAAVHLVAMAVALAALIAHRPPSSGGLAAWVMLMGSVTVASLVVRAQKAQVEDALAREARSARTDSLTGLPNRRALIERYAVERNRARVTRSAFALVIADLDHFKAVNDRFGHDEGDKVLRELAALLDTERRPADLVARLGGEEFVVLLPDTDLQAAEVIAERIRVAVSETFAGAPVPLTISLGVTAADGDAELAEALSAADRALYTAKRQGRNRVQSAPIPAPALA